MTSKEEILRSVNKHRIKRLDSIIDRQEKQIRTTKRYAKACWVLLMLTLLSGLLVIWTGKITIVEPNCESLISCDGTVEEEGVIQ